MGISHCEDVERIIDLFTRIEDKLGSEEPYKSAILEPMQVLGVDRFGETQKRTTANNQ